MLAGDAFKMAESLRANFAEMKRTFLLPALEKINALTPLKVSMTEADNGKLVFSILARPLQLPPLNT